MQVGHGDVPGRRDRRLAVPRPDGSLQEEGEPARSEPGHAVRDRRRELDRGRAGVVGDGLDCDNILPHPTFAIFGGKTTTGGPLGAQVANLGQNGKQHGFVTAASNTQAQIWPAFSLSGDYLVKGEFDLQGQHYSCTQKVQVRWPGLRAEMCWDVVAVGSTLSSDDLDLHFARLQGNTSCGGKHGWFDSCGGTASHDDCYYACSSGCRTGNQGFCAGVASAPGWGYAASTSDACHGWGSRREAQQSCDNPRLDSDNISCDVTGTDPNNLGLFGTPLGSFCGPENINLDNPAVGDEFAVGVHFFGGTGPRHPHVNVYCNGERKLALGYDPTTTPPTTYPQLLTPFDGTSTGNRTDADSGDFWEAVRVQWTGAATDPCAIETIPSAAPKAQDGSSNACVDTDPRNGTVNNATWQFDAAGDAPHSPAAASSLCWH